MPAKVPNSKFVALGLVFRAFHVHGRQRAFISGTESVYDIDKELAEFAIALPLSTNAITDYAK